MKRRTFIGAASALMAGAYALPAASKDEDADIRRAVDRRYRESMVLRRGDEGWRTALLHSTLTGKPE